MMNQKRCMAPAVASLLFVALSGCVSQRMDYYAFCEKGEDNIATKYRYTIVGYRTKAFDEYSHYFSEKQVREYEDNLVKTYSSEFGKLFPNVFSEDGIPIVLKDVSSISNNKMSPITVLSILTLFAVPISHQWDSETTFEISIANSRDIEGCIKIGCAHKRLMSSIVPPSLLFNDEPAEPVRDAGYSISYSSNNDIFFVNPFSGFKDANKPCAYALASKLKEMEATGQMDYYYAITEFRRRAVARQPTDNYAKSTSLDTPLKRLYRIKSLCRERDSDFAYTFALELSEDVSISTFFGMFDIFAYEVQAAYQREFPNTDASTLRVDVRHQVSDGMIVGRAEVLTIKPVKLNYDASTRMGKLAVRFNANQYEEARKWIRNNIEKLVRDKNIALVAGKIPPEAKYYSLNESLTDGNILEIEFKTE